MIYAPLTLLLVLASAGVNLQAAPDGSKEVAMEYLVRIQDPATGLVEVSLTLGQAPDSRLEFTLPERFAYTALEEPLLAGQVTATGGASIERLGPYRWALAGPTSDEVHLGWSVPQAHRALDTVSITDAYEYPYLAADHGMLVAASLFLVPDFKDGDVKATVRVRLELPEGWSALMPWPQDESGAYVPRSLGDLHNDLFAVGAKGVWQTRVIDAGPCEVTVAAAPSHVGLLERVGAPIETLVRGELALFERTPRERYLFLFGRSELPPTPGSFSLAGSPKGSSMTLLLGGDVGAGGTIPDEVIRQEIGHLIAHEFFHTWTASDIPFPDELRFVSEGFTDYYASLLEARLGLMDWKAFAGDMESAIEGYLKASASGDMSLVQAGGPAFFQGGDAYAMCYAGGMTLAALTDLSIRNQDNGKTLDDFMRAFNNDPRYLAGALPTLDEFFATLATFAGEKHAARLKQFAISETPFDVQVEFAGASLGVQVNMGLEQPDLRANLAGTLISGIDPTGYGASLGLRDGDDLKSVNGALCSGPGDIYAAWSSPKDGRMRFTYERGGESVDVDVALRASPTVVFGLDAWPRD